MPNGTLVANDWDDLVSGGLRHGIDRTESGALSAVGNNERTWTNTQPNGLTQGPAGADCEGWTNPTGASSGSGGQIGESGSGWTAAYSSSCAAPLRAFYCLQQ